jgi:hypothetical protein
MPIDPKPPGLPAPLDPKKLEEWSGSSYVTCSHCGERYGTPPGECELVDHVEAFQALLAAGAEALPKR